VVIPALAAAGHTPRLLNLRPIDSAHDLVRDDLRKPDDLGRAVAGVDAIVHAAALHGIHLRARCNSAVISAGHVFAQNVRRGHHELAVEVPAGQRLTVAFDDLALAI
jgi:nucleoside-diphosphate-sugar epimerase